MKISNLDAIIGIPEGKEDFVVQIFCENFVFGEIERRSEKQLLFRFFNNPNSNETLLRVDDLMKVIKETYIQLG